jgi:hypothetical protein
MTTIVIQPTREKKGYRLRCRFKTDAYPMPSRLDREKVTIAEKFVQDMHKQGWEHDVRHPFKMIGPFPMVTPVTIRPRRLPAAREMYEAVRNGARFLDSGEDTVRIAPRLLSSEYWEYELGGVFVRSQILTERPDAHEEIL